MPSETRFRARIVIADDHKLVAQACKCLLEPEFEVVGIVADGLTLIRSIQELMPDVVILDVGIPHLNGLDAGTAIKRKHDCIKLLYLTALTNPDVAAEALRRGASGYLVKQCSADELSVAVRTILRGHLYLSTSITKNAIEFRLGSRAERQTEKLLSDRQIEILQLLAEGKAMKEIAGILQVRIKTVAYHKYNIMDKLEIKTNAGLIKYAIKKHMLAAA